MIAATFWEHAVPEPNTGCLLWTRALLKSGYGEFWNPRTKRMDYAHRHAWRLAHGDIPTGMLVCHKCDTRACVNPDHLFVGTIADNVHDARRKGRYRRKLTEADVRTIRASTAGVTAMSRKFGVTRHAIRLIRIGRTWAHVA